MVVVVLGLAACGDDSGNGDDGSAPTTTAEPGPTTTTTQPSATDDEEEAFAIVEDIYHERGDLIDELRQNPELLDDPESDHVERLHDLVTGDLVDTVEGNVSFARELADEGHRDQAAGEVMTDTGIYSLVAEGPDTITFQVCVFRDTERVDRDGNHVESAITGMFGVGEARRVDGVWKLAVMDRDTRVDLIDEELTPGTLFRGACDAYAGADGEGSS